jgi:hypothetical protein
MELDHTLVNIIGFVVSWMLLGVLASYDGVDSRGDDNRPTG